LTNLAIDTSALVAILTGEPEAESFIALLDQASGIAVSAATLHEAYCMARRSGIERGSERLDRLIELTAAMISPFDVEQLYAAKVAYRRYGRGTGHAANLNMGDCFAYALAKTRQLPLLFKGDDFIHTDIEAALTPSRRV
jgi:ribonuclease VapC